MEQDERNQKAVYWAANGTFDDHGQAKVSAGIQVDVRWEYRREELSNPVKNLVAYDATIVVDRNMPEGSILWLGTLAAYNALSTGPTHYSVVANSGIPDVKNRATRRVVKAAKYGTLLPTIV